MVGDNRSPTMFFIKPDRFLMKPKAQRVVLQEEGSALWEVDGKYQLVQVADSNVGAGATGDPNKLKNYTSKAEFDAAIAQLATKAEVSTKADASEVAQKANAADVEAALLQKMDKASMVNYATKTDLSGKVDVAALQAQLDLKADKTQIDGFATRAELASKADSATVNAAIALKANAADIAVELAKKADKTDLAPFATKEQVNIKAEQNLAAVQGLIAEKANKSELAGKADKDALEQFYTKPETDALLDKKLDKTAFSTAMAQKADVTDLDGLATTGYVDAKVGQKADKSELGAYYTKEQVDGKIAPLPTKSELQSGLAGKLNTNALNGYATQEYVQNELDKIDFVDETRLAEATSTLAPKVYVDTQLANKLGPNDIKGLATTDYVDEQIGAAIKVDTSRFATTEYVDNKTTGLASVQYVNEQTGRKADKEALDTKVDKDALKSYYTKTDVDDKLAGKLDTSTFQIEIVRKADKSELEPFATKTEVAQGLGLKADKTSLQGLATESYVDEKIDGLVTDSELQAGLEGKLNNNALDPYYNKDEVDTLLSVLATQAQIAELEEKKLNSNVLVTTLQNGYYDKREIDRKLANIQVGSGSGGGDPGTGGGSAYLTSDIQVTNVVGNASGTMVSGTALEEVIFKMLTKTQVPTLTPPSASITGVNTTTAKVGTSITGLSVRVQLNRGSISPAYGTNGYRAGAASGYLISVSGANTTHTDNNTTGVFSLPALTRSSKGQVVITGTAKYNAGQQPKNSDGGNYQSPLQAGQVTATATINFLVPFVWGAIQNVEFTSWADVVGKKEDLLPKGDMVKEFTTNNQHMLFAFDSSYGNLKNIIDPNGFPGLTGWTQKVMTLEGISYNVYITNLPSTTVNSAFTFKF